MRFAFYVSMCPWCSNEPPPHEELEWDLPGSGLLLPIRDGAYLLSAYLAGSAEEMEGVVDCRTAHFLPCASQNLTLEHEQYAASFPSWAMRSSSCFAVAVLLTRHF